MAVWGSELAPPPVLEPSAEDKRLARIELALAQLASVLEPHDQAPIQVHVEPQDLSEIVTAVTNLKPGVTAEDIASAVAAALNVPKDDGTAIADLLAKVAERLELLDFRLKGGFGGGGGGANALTDTQLRATALTVQDDYQAGEVLADQTGAGAVLTFTFSAAVNLVVATANGAVTDICRVDPFGGTPSATLGMVLGDEAPAYLPITTTSVKVFAPAGVVVSVAGFRRG